MSSEDNRRLRREGSNTSAIQTQESRNEEEKGRSFISVPQEISDICCPFYRGE